MNIYIYIYIYVYVERGGIQEDNYLSHSTFMIGAIQM